MKTIPADEVDHAARAMVVRYQQVANDPKMLSVQITAESIEGNAEHVERCEVALICSHEEMTASDAQARVEAEGQAREIDCVAWIEEINP